MKGLTARLLIFNLLLAVFPLGAILFLGTYESQLLESQEMAMVQQGRLLASALEGRHLEEEAKTILGRLGARTDARLRVVDNQGRLLADSAQETQGNPAEVLPDSVRSFILKQSESEDVSALSYPEERIIYQIGALPTRTYRRFMGFIRPPVAPTGDAEFYVGKEMIDGPEIQSALQGRYGAATRISRGQRSVTLYSAIPIFQDTDIIGAVLVSRSTFAILTDLYQLRLDIMRIFLVSVATAILLSILLARTVTVPVGRLRDQAESLLDKRGKLLSSFKPLSGKDEVADLSRALHHLSLRLQERTDKLEDFMADLVHEIKNPVAGILSAAELAEETAKEETQRFLAVIDRESRRIQRLLDDLKELISVDVRLNRGQQNITDVPHLLRDIADSYPMHHREGVSIQFLNSNEIKAMVDADPDRLAQAVLNLVDNAVSFSPEGETIEIDLETIKKDSLNGGIRITVSDRGPGVLPNTTSKIFERWYTDRPEGEASSHTGLGLAIVQGIAEGYGGNVYATPRKGGGTIFAIEFPQME